MATALGGQLILDHDAGKPGTGITFDGALNIRGVAVAGIAIADHGNVHRFQDGASLVEHFAIGDQAGVGAGQAGGRHGEAAHEGERESRLFHQPRG